MPIDLTGIQNVGEFYSHHYLDVLLEGDLKGLFARWSQDEAASPDERLNACATAFFRAKSDALKQRRPADRHPPSQAIHVELLEALGYPYDFQVQYLADGSALPLLSAVKRDGRHYAWIAETPFAEPDEAPLDQVLLRSQYPPHPDGERYDVPAEPWESLVGEVFRRDEPPRWLILLAGRFVYLIDRTKWGQGQYLLFDLDEIFGRRQREALRAAAALLARDAICPDEGVPLHDTLDENSHKHAYAVSEDLKYGVRRAVELLANEYVWYQRNIGKQALFQDDDLARKLTREALTYLYRLLFLFYAEARGSELGLVPMKSEAYRTGYSLESLRDLEQVPLNTPQAQKGYYLDASLNQLFKLINEGFPPGLTQLELQEADQEVYDNYGFTVTGLRSPLFDRARTPLLASAKFRNAVLQEVLQLLSLSREKGSRKSVRGRISYAQLGINQLGAVYEGLLSYTGFFAGEPLVKVKPAGAGAGDEMTQTYFVPLSQAERYKREEFVYEEGVRKTYPRGTFIFRLAGRDREKTASYYTPEVLTRCVVKYSLKELLPGKTADEILHLTLCEPAMGSGAFVNEALNQLADAYLARKQEELGEEIPPEQYRVERQKVKAYLAQHNVYGVDLNSMAIELAQVSVWLNTIYPGMAAPWYEARLAVGNSLIGARRQVYGARDVQSGAYAGKAPTPVPLGQPRPEGSVYHWLLPDKGMAAFDGDQVIRELAPDEVQAIKDWRKGFTARITAAELKNLQALSDMADALWARHVRERQDLLEQTREPIPVWGHPEPAQPPGQRLSIEDKQRALARLRRPTSPYRRLKLAMDYWCSLWFWPIPQAHALPDREEFLNDMADILRTEESGFARPLEQGSLFGEPAAPRQKHLGELAPLDVDFLSTENWRLRVACDTAEKIGFHHWELAFAEVFAERGGFALTTGNPPWVKLSWNESGLLSDYDPILALRKMSASQVAQQRERQLKNSDRINEYLDEFVGMTGSMSYLNALQNYPLLRGVQSNLYKCFITRSWEIGADNGFTGLLHPEGVFDDAHGGLLRKNLYTRLRHAYRFTNVLKLFADILHWVTFCVCVYRAKEQAVVGFYSMSNVFHPSTVEQSELHDGSGSVPAIKDEQENWDLRGHRSRRIRVTLERLRLFAALYDAEGTDAMQARLPLIHSEEIVNVLEKFGKQSRRLGDLSGRYYSTVMWDQTHAQKKGTIRNEIRYPNNVREWIVSGPHFYVATPFNKNPNENCRNPLDYADIDLTTIPDDFLPRTNFVPACSRENYAKRTPKWNGIEITKHYRHIHRRRLSQTGERTLVNAIIPPGVSNLDLAFSINFDSNRLLVEFSGLCSSVVFDFFVKSTGKSDMRHDLAVLLPLPKTQELLDPIVRRTLRLNCLTMHYADLWEELYDATFPQDGWGKKDPRLQSWTDLVGPTWQRDVALRTFYERRQALVEIDVLAAMALDLSLGELLTIYRVQFPVLQKHERRMFFDQRGMQVPVRTIRGELGPNEDHPDFPDMVPPFTPVDREADYREAWAHFEQRLR